MTLRPSGLSPLIWLQSSTNFSLPQRGHMTPDGGHTMTGTTNTWRQSRQRSTVGEALDALAKIEAFGALTGLRENLLEAIRSYSTQWFRLDAARFLLYPGRVEGEGYVLGTSCWLCPNRLLNRLAMARASRRICFNSAARSTAAIIWWPRVRVC